MQLTFFQKVVNRFLSILPFPTYPPTETGISEQARKHQVLVLATTGDISSMPYPLLEHVFEKKHSDPVINFSTQDELIEFHSRFPILRIFVKDFVYDKSDKTKPKEDPRIEIFDVELCVELYTPNGNVYLLDYYTQKTNSESLLDTLEELSNKITEDLKTLHSKHGVLNENQKTVSKTKPLSTTS